VPKVMLFSTSTCSGCHRAKRYFKEHRGLLRRSARTFPITTRRFRVVLPGGRLELAEAYR